MLPSSAIAKPGASMPPRLVMLLVAAATAAATFLVQLPVLRCTALSLDDSHYLTGNPLVHHPSWQSTWTFLRQVRAPSTVTGYYQPLAMISLMLDVAIGGTNDNLLPFHRTSLLLHALNAALAAVLIFRLFRRAWIAVGCGLLFSLHPLTVDSIAWIAERKTVLATCLALAATHAYLSYAGRPTVRRYGLVTLLLAAAFLSKPTTIPFPIVFMLLDLWPLRRSTIRTLMEKVPLLALSAVAGVVAVVSQRGSGEVVTKIPPSVFAPIVRVVEAFYFYATAMIWPAALVPYYEPPTAFAFADSLAWSSLAVTAGAFVIGGLLWRRTRAPLVALLIVLLLVLPTIGLFGFTPILVANRYAYAALLGQILAVAAALVFWFDRVGRRARQAIAGLICIMLFAENLAMHRYLATWRDTETHLRYMITGAPNAAKPRFALGEYYQRTGRRDAAAKAYAESLAREPDFYFAHNNLGALDRELGLRGEAWFHIQEAVRLNPKYAEAHFNLGTLYLDDRRYTEAAEELRATIAIQPVFAPAYFQLGEIQRTQGDFAGAVASFREAVRLDPDSSIGHDRLGVVMAAMRQTADAAFHFAEALRLDPSNSDARRHLEMLRRNSSGRP